MESKKQYITPRVVMEYLEDDNLLSDSHQIEIKDDEYDEEDARHAKTFIFEIEETRSDNETSIFDY